jgi:hypothetical protein
MESNQDPKLLFIDRSSQYGSPLAPLLICSANQSGVRDAPPRHDHGLKETFGKPLVSVGNFCRAHQSGVQFYKIL